MSLNRMLSSLKRRPTASSHLEHIDSNDNSCEAVAVRNLILFCESGAQKSLGGSEEEVLYLPIIVDACESSPTAAKEAAYQIRKLLSKENYNRPYVQYNCVMLIRILADNPGATFTRNIDVKFVQIIKDLYRAGRDPNVQHILVETLNRFLQNRLLYQGSELLVEMWEREQQREMRRQGPPEKFQMTRVPIVNPFPLGYFPHNNCHLGLPAPQELKMRIEEARTSSRLLIEVIQSTPDSEIANNELAQDLSSRCQSASLNIQMFITAENPSPDNDTMEILIDTNDKISKAISKYRRAILRARKNDVPKHPLRKPGSSTPSRVENPFVDPISDLHQIDSDEKHKIKTVGSDNTADSEKMSESAPKNPIYRY